MEKYSIVRNFVFHKFLYGIIVYFVETYAGFGLNKNDDILIISKIILPNIRNTIGKVNVASNNSNKGATTNLPPPNAHMLNPVKNPL